MSRILLADDNADLLTVQCRLLEALDYQVIAVASAEAALHGLQEAAPHLLIVDLRIPTVADGLSLIHAIRAAGCQAPLIVLSGWPDDLYGTPEEALVSRIVVKGSTRALLDAIRELLPA